MAKLLYSARLPDGSATQGYVEADSAQAAQQTLHARGFTDVVFQQIMAAAQVEDHAELLRQSGLSEDDLARMQTRFLKNPGFGSVLAEATRKNRWILLAGVIALAAAAYLHSGTLLVLGLLMLLVPYGLLAWTYRSASRYDKLLRADALGDWDRVRELAELLQRQNVSNLQVQFDLAIRLASIRARRGELTPALAELQPWREALAQAPGLFESRLASVHYCGGDRAGFVRCMNEAYERSGHDPAQAMDCALGEARFGSADRAGELLSSLDASLLPPHGQPFVAWVQGLIAVRTGDRKQALAQLDQALVGFLGLASHPAAWPSLAMCTCDHALLLASMGNKEQARREIRRVWKVARAQADKPLLRMLKADGLLPQQSNH